MKVLGSVNPEYDENGEVVNTDYMGGTIAMLTEREMTQLNLLQQAWDDKIFKFPPSRYEADERSMDDAFKAIRCFVETKFALNEFRACINDLDSLLVKGKSDE
jgi:hypothetical protein